MVKKSFILFFLIFSIYTLYSIFFSVEQKSLNSIKLGASLPLSGINQNLGNEVVSGASAYFNHINKLGGVNGKKIEFIYYDDKYEPEIMQNNVQKLLNKDKVFALFDLVGTPTTKNILPLVINSAIPLIAPYTGASFLRNPKIPNIVNLRSSYEEEIDALVTYLSQKKGVSRVSIFYQNDEYGKEGYIATLKALKKRNLSLISEGTYKRNTLFVKQAIYDIQNPKPQAIILVGAYKPTARFIEKSRTNPYLEKAIFCPISFVNADALVRELDYQGGNIVFSQTVPSYTQDGRNETEYKKLLNKNSPNKTPSFASYESYLAAKIVVKALERCGKDINKDNFLHQLKNLPKNALDDLEIDYQNSQLLNKVYLLKYSNGKFITIGIEK